MVGAFGALVWIVVAVLLVFIEAMTTELVVIWFTLGSLLAALTAYVGGPFWLQLLICLIASVSVLIVARPLVLEKITVRKQPTNADRVVGQLGMVTVGIDNLLQSGRVMANGLDWSARSEYGDTIPEGTPVEVLRIDGVKLIVRKLPDDAPPEPDVLEPDSGESVLPDDIDDRQSENNIY